MPSPTRKNAGEEVLVYLLANDADTVSLVSTRISPDQTPINWKGDPALVYQQSHEHRQRVLSGDETGLVHARFSIYCCDRNRGSSRLLAQVVRAALHNQMGTIAGVLVRQVFVTDGERDESLPGVDGSDAPERYRTLDCMIHYIVP